MQTLSITIGRNIGSEPLPDFEWLGYVRAVTGAVRLNATNVEAIEIFHGHGTYHGIAEESALIVARGENLDWDYAILTTYLANLAHDFGQDAIAITYGESELVYA